MSTVAFTYPTYDLSEHFRGFFRCLNPKPTFIQRASSQYNTIKDLIENRSGPAAELAPFCFLQGSYDQSTAIYTINDVDIVVLCSLWQPGAGASGFGYRSWDRNAIFDTIATPLLADGRYKSKVYYGPTSMCIKVDLGIKVEILPVVFKQGTTDKLREPFRLWRPENNQWEDGYARYHQALLCIKNDRDHACGNFIPMVKILKHLRSLSNFPAVSFFLECLLYTVPDNLFLGNPATYLTNVLGHLASRQAADWYLAGLKTPCGERSIFHQSEWSFENWMAFHAFLRVWAKTAQLASSAMAKTEAIQKWQELLGRDFFPAAVA